jgi:hypothetical protein
MHAEMVIPQSGAYGIEPHLLIRVGIDISKKMMYIAMYIFLGERYEGWPR